MFPGDTSKRPFKLPNSITAWSKYVRQLSTRFFSRHTRNMALIPNSSQDRLDILRSHPTQLSRNPPSFGTTSYCTTTQQVVPHASNDTRQKSKHRFTCPSLFRRNSNEQRRNRTLNRRVYSNPRIRMAILACCVSGLFVVILLSLYLVLAFNPNQTLEVHVLLIIIIMITTVFFCHTLIRLCLMILKLQSLRRQVCPDNGMVESSSHVNSVNPIPVTVASDEELAGVNIFDDVEAVRIPPPAYGIWRESVRMDPNQVVCQHTISVSRDTRSVRTSRPPSYLMDEGLSYLVDAIATRPTSAT